MYRKRYSVSTAVFVCLVAVAATVLVAETAAVENDKSAGDVKQSAAAVKRSEPTEDEMESLVSAGRALRNSYVRFGRSSLVDDQHQQLLQPNADDKRSKHYVRFGRDGRHYVRFGRSDSTLFATADPDEPVNDGDAAVAAKRAGEKHYVRFGRNAEAVEPGTRFRRGANAASGRQYVRYGRNEAAQLARAARQAAGKHYVRFGRSGGGMAAVGGDENGMDEDGGNGDVVEEEAALRPDWDDKRSGSSKHYVRFGRSQQLADDNLDIDDESSTDKRSKHYVRFGRAGGADDDLDEIADEKRANYVRFG